MLECATPNEKNQCPEDEIGEASERVFGAGTYEEVGARGKDRRVYAKTQRDDQ